MASSVSSATSRPATLQLTAGTSYGYGYGFVHYGTEEASKQAIECANGMHIGEETVHATRLHRRGERDRPDITNYTHLYIEEQLNVEVSAFGTVTSMAVRAHVRRGHAHAGDAH